jgi:hypothetical protein
MQERDQMTREQLLADNPTLKLGDDVTLGDWVTLGNRVKLGDGVKLGNGVKLGDWVTLGNRVKLGDWVKLGNRVTLVQTPVQIYCHPYIVYPYSPTQIGVGCVIRDVAYWLRSEDPDELKAHSECQPWSRYREAIALVAAHMDDLTLANS